MLKLTHIKIQNWRNFGTAEFSLGDRLFIVGANASGKSNLLDVFRFLKDIAAIGLQKAVDNRGGIKKLRYLNARRNTTIEIAVKLLDAINDEEWLYQLNFNSVGNVKGHEEDVNISIEKVTRNGENILDRKYSDRAEDNTSRQFTFLEHPSTNSQFRVIFDYFKTVSYVNIIPQFVRERDFFSLSQSSEHYYGGNLLDAISAIGTRKRDARLKIINEVLMLAVPQFSALKYIVDEKDNRPHLQVNYKHWRQQGAHQREDQFSDGTLRLVGIIWAIMDGNGLLLLEEPELYLHTEIIRQLPVFIGKAQRRKNGEKRQVIISSHSADLLATDTIGTDEIAVLESEKEGTLITMASNITDVMELMQAGFYPADAVIPHVTPSSLRDGGLSSLDVSGVSGE
jgi:predicted ATPase